jgi:hypothetical protein
VDLIEPHVPRAAVLNRAFAGASERLRIPVDAQNAPLGTHKIGGQQRNIPHAAAEIENAHTGRQSACPEKALGADSKDGRLLQQPLLFMLGVSEDIVGCRH